MRILFVFVICLLCGSLLLYAEVQKEFAFLNDVIDALHYCQRAVTFEPKAENDVTMLATSVRSAIDEFRKAKNCIRRYMDDNDAQVVAVAQGISDGIFLLVNRNNETLEKVRKITDFRPLDITHITFDVEKFRTQTKDGWRLISSSACKAYPEICTIPGECPLHGKIPFKLSRENRENLIAKLDTLFGDLKDSGEHTGILVAITKIRDTLSAETFEDLKGKEMWAMQ